jgi:hypothetical protein
MYANTKSATDISLTTDHKLDYHRVILLEKRLVHQKFVQRCSIYK